MDHAEKFSTMVPPTPGHGLGLTPKPSSSTTSTNKRQRPDSDDETATSTFFKSSENFAKYLVIKSVDYEKPITSLSPFVIEKQIEATIGTPKSVKKLKNKTLLIETNRKAQTDNLLKMTTFFNIPVTVTEHNTLNSSKGIIRDRALKGLPEQEILEYLKDQGVTAVKRFTIKKDQGVIETNTLLLTFNMINVPKNLKTFYRIIPVDIYIPNPLRCFNCQKFSHHENNCPEDIGSVCEKCGVGHYDHLASKCKNPVKCVNCGKDHLSRSNECEIWKKEKEIMKIKVTQNLSFFEARKIFENKPEVTFATIVQSSQIKKPETKATETHFDEKDFNITASSKVIIPTKYKQNKQAKNTATTSKSSPQSQTSDEKAKRESRSRQRNSPSSRQKSKSPKNSQNGHQKDKPIKLVRLQDNSIKLTNRFDDIEQMESENSPNT